MKTTKDIESMKRRAAELAATEVCVAHNAGTFGASECQRAVGTGEAKYGEYQLFVRVGDGRSRVVGCDPAVAPGYRRQCRESLERLQRELAELRAAIAMQE